MINCPKCKAELSDQDVFCFVCGQKMEQQSLSEQQAQVESVAFSPCPKCNAVPLSAEDVFCAECGFRFASEDQPSAPEIVPPPVVEEIFPQKQEIPEEIPQQSDETPLEPVIPPVVPKSVESAQTQQQPVIQTVQQKHAGPLNQLQPKKKKRTGKIIFTILLILLIIVLVGGGLGAFLIYNGNVSRQSAGQYIPKSMLDMIPKAEGSATATASRYFVVYSFGQFDKQPVQKGKKAETEKLAVISDIFTNLDAGTETNDGAEVVFRNEGNSQIKQFSRFKKFFVNSFSSHQEAMTEREKIIQDMKTKGYKRQFVRIVK